MSSHTQVWRCGVLWRGRQCCSLGSLSAADEAGREPVKIGRYNPDAGTVDLFAAISATGRSAVSPCAGATFRSERDPEQNRDQPLNVKLPDSFVGVPILARSAVARSGTQRRRRMGSYGSAGRRACQSFAAEGRTVQRTDGLP